MHPTSRDLGTAEQAGFWPNSAHRLAIGPPALGHNNPTVCSLACRWQIRLALRANRESFSVESGPLLDSNSVRQIFIFVFVFVNISPNIHIHIRIRPFLIARINSYSYSPKNIKPNIFLFLFGGEILSRIYLHSYSGRNIKPNIFVFVFAKNIQAENSCFFSSAGLLTEAVLIKA